MLGKTPFLKDLLINFAEGAEIISLICFISFVGMLLVHVLFIMLRLQIVSDISISSSVVDVMKISPCLDLGGSLYNIS